MSPSNLPPGLKDSDLPGCSPDALLRDRLADEFDHLLPKERLEWVTEEALEDAKDRFIEERLVDLNK